MTYRQFYEAIYWARRNMLGAYLAGEVGGPSTERLELPGTGVPMTWAISPESVDVQINTVMSDHDVLHEVGDLMMRMSRTKIEAE